MKLFNGKPEKDFIYEQSGAEGSYKLCADIQDNKDD